MEAVTAKEDKGDGVNIKYGLKNTLFYLLMRAADNLEGEAFTKRGPEAERKVAEMTHFQKILKHHENSVFGMPNTSSTNPYSTGYVSQTDLQQKRTCRL